MNNTTCVMIVDDEEINREMLRYILSPHFGSFLVAADGGEALSLLAQGHQVDVILLDLEMPVLDGLQTTRQIRVIEQAQGGHIPVIAMTASELPEDIERCHHAGMDAFVSKPFRLEDILSAVERVMSVSPELSPSLTTVDSTDGEQRTVPSETVSEAVFNYQGLLARVGNRKDQIADYVDMFTEEIDQDLPALERAILAEDGEAIARLTHSIRGTTCNIGAERMFSVAKELAVSVRNSEGTVLRSLLATLQTEYRLFKSVLEKSAF